MGEMDTVAIAEILDIHVFYIVYKISRLKEEFSGSLEIPDKLNSRPAGPCSV